MEKDKPKVLHAELKGNLSTRFNIIKSFLGIQNDAEVVRFLIQNYYKEYLEKEKIVAREEIEHAILLVAPTAGFPKMMEGLMILRDEFDKS